MQDSNLKTWYFWKKKRTIKTKLTCKTFIFEALRIFREFIKHHSCPFTNDIHLIMYWNIVFLHLLNYQPKPITWLNYKNGKIKILLLQKRLLLKILSKNICAMAQIFKDHCDREINLWTQISHSKCLMSHICYLLIFP